MDGKATQLLKCKGCDTLIKPFKNKAYCSQKCYQKRRRTIFAKNHYSVHCGICNQLFKPKKTSDKYCSDKCRSINRRNYYSELNKRTKQHRLDNLLEGLCRHCGKQFILTRPNKAYCTKECKEEHWKWRIKKRALTTWLPKLRDVTEKDITTSLFPEQIREYKRSGKKILTFPTLRPNTHDINIDGVGEDNDNLTEDLIIFKERK